MQPHEVLLERAGPLQAADVDPIIAGIAAQPLGRAGSIGPLLQTWAGYLN